MSDAEINVIEGHVFKRRFFQGKMHFYFDEKEVSLSEWNHLLNRYQSMVLLEKHPNPIIRFKEKWRRYSFLETVRKYLIKGQTVLADIGSEAGYLSAELAQYSKKLYCLDIDQEMINQSRQRLKRFNQVEYVVCDISRIKMPDNIVDLAIAAEILEHTPDPRLAIKELSRITKPKGKIIISIPNENLIQDIKGLIIKFGMRRALGKLSQGMAPGHIQNINKAELTKLCRGLIKIERIWYNPPFFMNIFCVGTPEK